MSIDIVVATTLNGGLGLNNELLIHCKADMKRFREKTLGQYVLMGSKTFESLPKPLKNRVNVVLSRREDYYINPEYLNQYEIILHNSLDEILNKYNSGLNERNLVIAGGGELYRQTLVHADRVFLTVFHEEVEADTFFPLDYLTEHFNVVKKEECIIDGLWVDFIDYVRKGNV